MVHPVILFQGVFVKYLLTHFTDYVGEFGSLVSVMSTDPKVLNQNMLIGPNLATGDWTPEQIWDTGFVDTYSANLAFLAVEQYAYTIFPAHIMTTDTFLQLPNR